MNRSWGSGDTIAPSLVTPVPARWARPVDVLAQFLLVLGAGLVYFFVRGLTQGGEVQAIAHGEAIVRFEQAVGLHFDESMQAWMAGSRPVVTLGNWVYIWGHWPVIAATLYWLYRNDRRRYLLLRNAMFASGAVGVVIFALYPVAPPRLLATGFVDTVTEFSTSYRVLQPPALVNKFAALPSLHVGWNLLVGVVLYRSSRSPAVRAFAVASPVAMTVAVVVTANHYVIDAVVGMAVALVGLAASYAIYSFFYVQPVRTWPSRPVARPAELSDQLQIVEDEPGDPPPQQAVGRRSIVDRPCEHGHTSVT